MPSPVISTACALTWEIWLRNHRWVALVVGIITFGWLFNVFLPESIRATTSGSSSWLQALNFTLAFVSQLIAFGIFNYTESNSQKDAMGFPRRLFTLPVSTLLLVAVPIVLGIVSVELVHLSWIVLIPAHGEPARPVWNGILLGTFMVLYQTLCWALARAGALRMLVLGVIGIGFIVIGFLPSFSSTSSTAWSVEKIWIGLLSGLALGTFLFAWMVVSRQRSGSGQRRNWINIRIDRIADGLPERRNGFASPMAAQFWFEWRRSGLLLPLIVGAMLLLVIGPLALSIGNDAASALNILIAALMMPAALALPLGKGLSKPDIWSNDLSLPAFTAVRPLSTDEMVAIKMKVAVRSTVVSWLLVLSFLALWLPFGANLDALKPVRSVLSQASGQASILQFAIAALVVLVFMLLTWRFLVGSLWIGLSGNSKLFVVSAIPYALLPIVGMIGLVLFQQRALGWVQHNLDRLLPTMEWIAVLAVIAKLSMAVFSWRNIAPQRGMRYLAIWLGSTLCLIALSMFVWTSLQHVLPSEVYGLRNLLVLCALLTIPLARPGLATRTLAKNRHR